jgi:hypothetical protein
VTFAVFKSDKTLAELAAQSGGHPAQITKWKQHLLARAIDVFGGKKSMSDGRISRASSWAAFHRPTTKNYASTLVRTIKA